MLSFTALSIGTNGPKSAAHLLTSAATMMRTVSSTAIWPLYLGVKPAAGALNHTAVGGGVGEVLRRLGLGRTELALEAPSGGLAVRVVRLAVVVLGTTTLDVCVTLRLFQPFARFGDGLQSNLAPVALGRAADLNGRTA